MNYGKDWSELSKKCLERDNHVCRRCSNPGNQVHHIIPRKETNDDALVNLVTLCRSCHKTVDNNYIRFGTTNHVLRWVAENISKLKRENVSPMDSINPS